MRRSGAGGSRCRRCGPAVLLGRMTEQTPPVPGAPQLNFRDPRGAPVAYDGAAPVTWRVGAYVLAERGGRVLMIESLQSGRWELPGGGVEVHETLPEGAARECFEETGYRVLAAGPDPLHVAEQFFSWRGEVRHYWHALSVVYRAEVAPEADAAWTPDPAEVRAVRWVDPAGLTPATTQPHQWPALRRAGLV